MGGMKEGTKRKTKMREEIYKGRTVCKEREKYKIVVYAEIKESEVGGEGWKEGRKEGRSDGKK
jgi:hypothetical protein